jgi:outer membrane biosynthesis protein TonB
VVLADPPSPPASFHPQALAQIEQIVFAQPKLAVLPSGESEQSDMNPAFIGPRPIHQSLPNLPSEIRATVLSEVEVQVKVQVDEYGRVVKVDLVEATGPASNALVSATQQAARLWRFSPGARGSELVASEVVLMFRYIPKTGGN